VGINQIKLCQWLIDLRLFNGRKLKGIQLERFG